jgi:crotonobetainyl-CoA:carnitine CoA-transferase CaiB-like acyl-CoA transferase
VLLAVGNDKQFNKLIGILPEHAIDIKKFSTNRMRVSGRTELNILLSAAILKMDSSELLQQIHHLKIPAGIIQNIKEVFEMRAADDLLIKADSLTGVRSYVAQGIDTAPSLLPPPHFGEHTAEILAALK